MHNLYVHTDALLLQLTSTNSVDLSNRYFSAHFKRSQMPHNNCVWTAIIVLLPCGFYWMNTVAFPANRRDWSRVSPGNNVWMLCIARNNLKTIPQLENAARVLTVVMFFLSSTLLRNESLDLSKSTEKCYWGTRPAHAFSSSWFFFFNILETHR